MLIEEEKKRSEEVRISKEKNLDIDFDKEFQQMISVLFIISKFMHYVNVGKHQ